VTTSTSAKPPTSSLTASTRGSVRPVNPYREPAAAVEYCDGVELKIPWWRSVPRRLLCPLCGTPDAAVDRERKRLIQHPRLYRCASISCRGPLVASRIQEFRQTSNDIHCAYCRMTVSDIDKAHDNHPHVVRGLWYRKADFSGLCWLCTNTYLDYNYEAEQYGAGFDDPATWVLHMIDPGAKRATSVGRPGSDWSLDNGNSWYCCKSCACEDWIRQVAARRHPVNHENRLRRTSTRSIR
jgi:hypothetical protein